LLFRSQVMSHHHHHPLAHPRSRRPRARRQGVVRLPGWTSVASFGVASGTPPPPRSTRRATRLPSRLPPPPLPLPLPPRRDRSRFARRDAPTRGASPPASAFLALAVAAFLVTDAHAAVSCGGHSASTCAECPQGNGAAWCNGECHWDDASSGCVEGCAQHAASAQCVAPLCEWMTPTAVCRDALAEGIRSASVHLYHTTPSTVAAPAWWFNRVVVTESSSVAYFMSNGFGYGYGGVQQVSKSPFEGRVIFSLWDQGECDRDVRSCAADLVARTVACGSQRDVYGFRRRGHGAQELLRLFAPSRRRRAVLLRHARRTRRRGPREVRGLLLRLRARRVAPALPDRGEPRG
jgi:hypothetical protein